jgi:hypothetical protein
MAAALSLIPELDDIVKNGSAEKRAERSSGSPAFFCRARRI